MSTRGTGSFLCDAPAAVRGMPIWTRWKISRSYPGGREEYLTWESCVSKILRIYAGYDALQVIFFDAKSCFHSFGTSSFFPADAVDTVYQYAFEFALLSTETQNEAQDKHHGGSLTHKGSGSR